MCVRVEYVRRCAHSFVYTLASNEIWYTRGPPLPATGSVSACLLAANHIRRVHSGFHFHSVAQSQCTHTQHRHTDTSSRHIEHIYCFSGRLFWAAPPPAKILNARKPTLKRHPVHEAVDATATAAAARKCLWYSYFYVRKKERTNDRASEHMQDTRYTKQFDRWCVINKFRYNQNTNGVGWPSAQTVNYTRAPSARCCCRWCLRASLDVAYVHETYRFLNYYRFDDPERVVFLDAWLGTWAPSTHAHEQIGTSRRWHLADVNMRWCDAAQQLAASSIIIHIIRISLSILLLRRWRRRRWWRRRRRRPYPCWSDIIGKCIYCTKWARIK